LKSEKKMQMETNPKKLWLLPVAHTCNPSYSGGRDRRIALRSQPRQIVHKTLSQKTPHKNRAGGVPQGKGPEFKPQHCTKKKKKKKKETCV
jgi:hypothetical protein